MEAMQKNLFLSKCVCVSVRGVFLKHIWQFMTENLHRHVDYVHWLEPVQSVLFDPLQPLQSLVVQELLLDSYIFLNTAFMSAGNWDRPSTQITPGNSHLGSSH